MTALQQAATRGFASHAEAFVRALNFRTALIAAGVLVGAALATLGGGYWWGRGAARADIHQTEAGLQAAFSRGPEAAANPIRRAPWFQRRRHWEWPASHSPRPRLATIWTGSGSRAGAMSSGVSASR